VDAYFNSIFANADALTVMLESTESFFAKAIWPSSALASVNSELISFAASQRRKDLLSLKIGEVIRMLYRG
jgi:hypothetical protein